jgi:hypothetical protein
MKWTKFERSSGEGQFSAKVRAMCTETERNVEGTVMSETGKYERWNECVVCCVALLTGTTWLITSYQ